MYCAYAPVLTTVLAFLSTPAVASRLSASVDVDADISVDGANVDDQPSLEGYEDITEIWATYDEGSSIDVKCCCEDSGRCGIFRTDGSCRWVGEDDRVGVGPSQGYVNRLRSYRTYDPPVCRIDSHSVEEVSRFLVRSQRASSTHQYCQEYDIFFGGDQVAGHVNSADYLQTIPFDCGPGFAEEVTQVRCDYHNITQGRFSPEPVCNSVPEFCHPIEVEFGQGLTAASNQEQVEVRCDHGYKVPSGGELTTCVPASVNGPHGGEGGVFHPEPACMRDLEFCNVSSAEDGGASASAAMGDVVPVSCPPGWEPETPTVSCTETREFSPAPLCEKIAGFCAAVSDGGATLSAAELGEVVSLTCDSGLVGVVQEVQCIASQVGGPSGAFTGAFEPQPRCGQHCLRQQTLLAGFVGDSCQGPSVNAGACYTRAGDPSPWHCWPEGQPHSVWTNDNCRDMGYEGACYFDEALEPANADDVGECGGVSHYAGECDNSWGACYVSHRIPFSSSTNDGRWSCIEASGARSLNSRHPSSTYSLGDCKVKPVPFQLARRIGRATYDSVCKI